MSLSRAKCATQHSQTTNKQNETVLYLDIILIRNIVKKIHEFSLDLYRQMLDKYHYFMYIYTKIPIPHEINKINLKGTSKYC